MSDYLIEQGMTEYEEWDSEWDDDVNSDIEPFPVRRTKTCKFCNETGLVWLCVNSKWRLHSSNGKMHICPVNPLK